MRHLLQRHPVPVKAWFRHSLVLTYALPAESLQPLLPPGLMLDVLEGHGFVAVAMVQTKNLRPAFLPCVFGQDFFLTGYRIFARYQTTAGRTLRGLRILRSDTDKKLMVWGGNLFTHYNYRHARVQLRQQDHSLSIQVSTPNAEADLDLHADLNASPAGLPPGSPFKDFHQARLFAGPLPFTFDYEPETGAIVLIEGVRSNWKPKPVMVDVRRLTFLERPPFREARPILANAFHVQDIPYEWKRGVRETLNESA